MYLSFIAIFAVVFSLYDLPVEAVGYATLLCGALALVLALCGFYRFCAKHRALAAPLLPPDGVSLTLDGLDRLPPPSDLIERDYRALVEAVLRDKARVTSADDAARRDLMEYYTLWVHQVKTPLAATRLLLQSDAEGRDTAALAELLKVEQYVDMALCYARLDGGSDLVIAPCDLDNVIRAAVRKFAKLFILKKLRLTYEPVRRTVVTDEKWLGMMVEQVLSNALKYTRTGGITIRLEGEDMLVIEDTGIGIAPEDLPRVFEKGFTGYNGRANQKSTGIGLYLCRRIAAMLSHAISIESEAGKGTAVRIGLAREEISRE